jgi:hypothetical protein
MMRMKQLFGKVVAEHGETVLRVFRVALGGHDSDDVWWRSSWPYYAPIRTFP